MEINSYDKVDPDEIIEKLRAIIKEIQQKNIDAQLNTQQEVKMVTKYECVKCQTGQGEEHGLYCPKRQKRKSQKDKDSDSYSELSEETEE